MGTGRVPLRGVFAYGAWLLMLALGCRADVNVPSGVFACAVEADCPNGMGCIDGTCFAVGDGDAGADTDPDEGVGDGNVGPDVSEDTGEAGVDAEVGVDRGVDAAVCSPVCEAPLQCVDGECRCAFDSDCARESFCNAGSCTPCIVGCADTEFCTVMGCFACRVNDDCAGSPETPACFQGSCAQCAGDDGCAARPDATVCVGGECVECRGAEQCSEPRSVCVDGSCAECGDNDDCTAVPNAPACVLGQCVECGNGVGCPSGMMCRGTECVPACRVCTRRSDCRSDESCIDDCCR